MNLHQNQAKYKLPEDCADVIFITIERTPGFLTFLKKESPETIKACIALDKTPGWPERYSIEAGHLHMYPTPHGTGDFTCFYNPVLRAL